MMTRRTTVVYRRRTKSVKERNSRNTIMTNNVSDLNGAMCDASATGRFLADTCSSYRPNLRYEVERVSNEGEKRLSLAPLLKGTEGSGIIYAATVKEVKAVADYLNRVGFHVAPYY